MDFVLRAVLLPPLERVRFEEFAPPLVVRSSGVVRLLFGLFWTWVAVTALEPSREACFPSVVVGAVLVVGVVHLLVRARALPRVGLLTSLTPLGLRVRVVILPRVRPRVPQKLVEPRVVASGLPLVPWLVALGVLGLL